MKFPLFFSLTLLLFCFSCVNTTQETNEHEGGANDHMHQADFETLVQKFDDTNRYVWQKPELIINKLGDLEGKAIADIGAGSGYFSVLLANEGANVIAIDIDDRFLSHIDKKDNGAITTRKTIATDPGLDSNSVDVAIIVNTYHHINDRVDYFNKVHAGLKSGGTLMVVDFKKSETTHGPPLKMRVSGFNVLKELQQSGFSKVIIDVNSLPEQYIITAKKRKPRS